QSVAKALNTHGLQNDVSGIKRVLLPVLICSLASEGALGALKSMNLGKLVNISDYDKRTPLHLAASSGHLHVVEYLVSQGADISAKDRFGNTPLSDSLKNKHDHVSKFLKSKNAKLDAKPLRMAVLLCNRAATGNLEDLKRYIEYGGVDVNIADYDKRTPLHLAASEGHLNIVKYLVCEKKANVNVRDRWNRTPLDDAISGKHF